MSSFNFQVTESPLKAKGREPVAQPEKQQGGGKVNLYVISKPCTWQWCFEDRSNKGLYLYLFQSFKKKKKKVGEGEY